jgi:hypothetical protein
VTEVWEGDPARADEESLVVLVDRLAADGSDRATVRARSRVRQAIAAGAVPPGLRRLAEGLAAGRPPVPDAAHPGGRHPDREPGIAPVVAAMRGTALAVLREDGWPGVAAAVAALLDDGRRVIVTAATPAELAAVRDALPTGSTDRVLDDLPALDPAQLRRLRTLIATATPARRARRDQLLPPAEAFPPVAEVAELCRQIARAERAGAGVDLVARLLAGLGHDRRTAVTAVARRVRRALAALRGHADRDWVWRLLNELVFRRQGPTYDRLLDETTQAAAVVERIRERSRVDIVDALPADALVTLRRYQGFLDSGGRSRSYFRPAAQREVEPVLRRIRVDGTVPETAEQVELVVEHLELAGRLTRIAEQCAELGVPAPRDPAELPGLAVALTAVAGAARSVSALRHEMLFLHRDSPLAVPDVRTAEQVAAAVVDVAEHGSSAQATGRLDRAADELAARVPAARVAPEHQRAVTALRDRDAAAYAAAVDSLAAARREVQDEAGTVALLQKLGERAPRLAAAWGAAGERPVPLGLVALIPVERLLEDLPPSDSADVLVVVGAAGMGAERLLLTAVAPRMVAVAAPGGVPGGGHTLLGVLDHAGAPVVRGRSGPVPGDEPGGGNPAGRARPPGGGGPGSGAPAGPDPAVPAGERRRVVHLAPGSSRSGGAEGPRPAEQAGA